MKDNVDLTLDRDFRDDQPFGLSVRDIIIGEFNRFPWYSLKNALRELRYDAEEIFLTGSKDDIAYKKRARRYESEEDTCECCGRNILPWNRVYMLCRRCNEDLEHDRDTLWFLDEEARRKVM